MDFWSEAWKMPVDRSQDPHREPGPIDVQRSQFQMAYSGIPTMFGLPICLNQDDLRAGNVDVAFVGAPVDMSVGHRGAAYGPRAIRSTEVALPNSPTALLNQTA